MQTHQNTFIKINKHKKQYKYHNKCLHSTTPKMPQVHAEGGGEIEGAEDTQEEGGEEEEK
jgi:hypothetical protein